MTKWRSSAAYRIAFTCSAAFALAILLLGITVYFAADAEFRSQRDQGIAEEATTLSHETNLAELKAEIAARERPNTPETFLYALFDRDGRRIAGSLRTAPPPPGLGTIFFDDSVEGKDAARAFTVMRPDGLRLVVALDSERIEAIDATILALFAGAFVIVLLGAVLGALILGHYLRRRLDLIGGTARAIVAGDLHRRIPIGERHDEFDQAGAAINAMLDRIAHLMDNLRQVSSDIAHDLRTPLLRLRNQLERLDSDPEAATKAIDQGDALLALFGSILRIAEVEGGALAAGFTPVDFSALAIDVGDSYHPAILDSSRTLDCDIAPAITVLGNLELLAQAIGNLLDNARIHTPPGTAIRLVLNASPGLAHLSVSDNGPGVPPADRQRILQRFVRGEASRTTPGAGLGLSLVAAVAAAHGGETVVSDEGPGFHISISLPTLS
ncbi:MAG TPA: HAMP domain-containing sensor histidine kinase [Sphingobium sp.]|uniref:sensor histidine kinase n=1 Tax=Sphingobium sp. TaxID=1912891 RepID=UPI002ED162C3